LTIEPGSKRVTRAEHLSKWDLHLASDPESPIHSLTIDEEEGRKQSFGSMHGTIPVKDETPVYLKIVNPHDSEVNVEVSFAAEHDMDANDEEFVVVLAPGESHGAFTFHGHIFGLYNVGEDYSNMGHIVVDAKVGEVQELYVDIEDEL
jgi:hypothetical protein